MAKMIASTCGKSYATIDEGVYYATLESIEVVTKPDTFSDEPGATREEFQYVWRLDEDSNRTLRSWTTTSTHEKSNTAKVLKALGVPLPSPGSTYDYDDWLYTECQLHITHYTKLDGSIGNKVASYMPLPRAYSLKE